MIGEKTAWGSGVVLLVNFASTASGMKGVLVIVGVLVYSGVKVMVGVCVIVGESVIVGVFVLVGGMMGLGLGSKNV
jgi:hypothetical protein